MPSTQPTRLAASTMGRVAAALVVVAALHLGREVLIPIALSVLLGFVLAPLVTRLERLGLAAAASVVVVVGLCFAGIGGIGFVVTNEMLELVEDLPHHRENLKQRLRSVRGSGGGAFEKAAEMVEEIQAEIDQEQTDGAGEGEAAPVPPFEQRTYESVERIEETLRGTKSVLPVRIVEPQRSTLERLPDLVGPLLGPLGTAGIVVVFVTFFLLQRRDLRDRLIRLVGETRLDVTTQAINEAGSRISRYLLAQLALSACAGVPVAVGLSLIGVPGAVLWGVLTMLLRFIPYIGPWLSALLPVLLSFAVFEGWARPLSVIALFVGLELFSNNVLEPWIYGSSTGMSAVAVITAAVFWGWLWGPLGILLSVPLTVCLVVLGKYVPKLEVFTILLGREPVFDPAVRFYQRVLALDDDEAGEIAAQYRARGGLLALYDELLLPALHHAERDRHSGHVDPERAVAVAEDFRSILEEVCGSPPEEEQPAASPEVKPILCLPARDAADEIAAGMLAHLLWTEGLSARTLPVVPLAGALVEAVRKLEPRVVCISALPPATVAHSRSLCLHLKRHFPKLEVVIGLWDWTGDTTRATNRLRAAGADFVATDFARCLERLRGAAPVPELGSPVPPE